MKNRKTFGALLIAACLGLLLAACSPTSNPPSRTVQNTPAQRGWMLTWIQKNQKYTSPQDAYSAQARVQNPSGQDQVPKSTSWLATGNDFALVLVQYDVDGKFFGVGALELKPDEGWILTQSIVAQRPTPGNGFAMQKEYRWLPSGNYLSSSANIGLGASQGSVQLWLSEAKEVFVVAHLFSHSYQPTTGTTFLTISGHTGWLTQQNGFTHIIVNNGKGTLIFAGTTDTQQSEQIFHELL